MGRHLDKTKRSISAQKIEAKKRLAHYADLETRREIRAAVAEWKYSDPLYREPDTLKALAGLLGISYPTIRRYKSSLPERLEDYLAMIQRNIIARALGTVTKMQDAKSAQAVAAGKYILEHYVMPMSQGKPPDPPETPKAIQDALNMIAGNQMRRQMEAEQAKNKAVAEEEPPETGRHDKPN